MRAFRYSIGTGDSLVDIGLLEHCIREELDAAAPRRICVQKPIRVVVTNYPEGKEEFFEFSNNPQNPDAGARKVVFTRELFIDADDFAEDPPPSSFRFKPGGEVRLMGAYIIRCNGIVKNPDGSIRELHCTADLETGSGNPASSRKVKDTVRWLSARYAVEITLMLYDKLFMIENVNDIPEGQTCNDYLNPDSLVRLEHCYAEPCLKDAKEGEQFQFVRVGYFCKDTKYSDTFNRIVGLK